MKNSKTVRLISALLLITILISLLTACAETNTPEVTTADTVASVTQAPVSETTSDPTKDENGYLKDDLPEDLDFGGEELTLLIWNNEHEEFVVTAEELSGDIVEQSIFDRNAMVEQRLGLNLEFIRIEGNSSTKKQWNAYVNNAVSINAREFDIVAGYSLSVALNASSGLLFNLLDDECEYLNFDKPWWSQLLLEQATFGDNLYFASGDISRNALEMMYVCFASNSLLEEYNLENPQSYVTAGEWTYEKFIEMCQGIYKDSDGNGEKNCDPDSGDTFGFVTCGVHTDPWFYGTGATICERNEDGEIIVSPSFSGERVSNTVDMLIEFLHNSEYGMYTADHYHLETFGQERTLFMIDRARVSHRHLAPKYGDVKYVVVPCPKYDTAQENYITVLGNPFTLYAMPADIEDPNMASAFIECFASEGYRTVTPAVFELSLKTRYVDDPVSAEMYDIIRANITYDIGRIFSSDLIGQSKFKNAIADCTPWASVAKQAVVAIARPLKDLNKALND